LAWQGKARQGAAGQGMGNIAIIVTMRQGLARPGGARPGKAGPGEARQGKEKHNAEK